MTKSKKPDKKLMLSSNLFNSLYSMLLYFIATEQQTGVTEFSKSAAKFKAQIDKYGRFIGSVNPADGTFIIYFFDSEVIQLMRLYNMYILIRELPTADFFTQICEERRVRKCVKSS
jgi:hypothetical protein